MTKSSSSSRAPRVAGTPGACSQVFFHPNEVHLGTSLDRHAVSSIVRTTHTTHNTHHTHHTHHTRFKHTRFLGVRKLLRLPPPTSALRACPAGGTSLKTQALYHQDAQSTKEKAKKNQKTSFPTNSEPEKEKNPRTLWQTTCHSCP